MHAPADRAVACSIGNAAWLTSRGKPFDGFGDGADEKLNFVAAGGLSTRVAVGTAESGDPGLGALFNLISAGATKLDGCVDGADENLNFGAAALAAAEVSK